MRIQIRFRIHLINFDADPDPDADPDFYLMRMPIQMRIQVTKMMRILADPDSQHWSAAHSTPGTVSSQYYIRFSGSSVTPSPPILSYSQCCGSGSRESGITWPPEFRKF